LLVGTGGNVGAQSSTVVIRGMNTDEVMSPLQVILREATGALLGSMLGVVATGWAFCKEFVGGDRGELVCW